MKWALAVALASLRAYQRFVSPLLPRACRFQPSCSRYGYDALQRYGLVKGSLMTMKRLFRCHPFHPGGFDPVK
jgi:hypothetical protein